MSIVIATAIVVVGFLTAFRMYVNRDERELRARAEIELRMKEAENTQKLFEAETNKQLKQATIMGEAEHEMAKVKRLQAEYELRQVDLARDFLSVFNSHRGERILDAHGLTIDGLLAAIARQLDGLEPNQDALIAANRLARQRAFGEKEESVA